MLILDLWGISFHAVVVFGLGKDLLFKSVLGRCVHEPKILLKSNDWKENNIALPLDHAFFLRLIGQNKEVLGQNQRLKIQKPDFSYEDFLIHKQAYQNPGFTLVNPTLGSVYRKQVVLFIPIIFFWGSLTADFSSF